VPVGRVAIALGAGSLAWLAGGGIAFAAAPSTAVASAAVFGGYAHQISETVAQSYKAGFGARGGVTLSRVYLGGAFTWHLGTSSDTVGTGSSYGWGYHAATLGAEAGWDFMPGPLLLRPYIAGGALLSFGDATARGTTLDNHRVLGFVGPGGLFAWRFGRGFAGLDLRTVMVPAETPSLWAGGAFIVAGATF
jgi:hypothetical protein